MKIFFNKINNQWLSWLILMPLITFCSLLLAAGLNETVKIPDDFFGLNIRWGASSTPWPYVSFQSWRVINPETEWRGLQPQKDVWNFITLDKSVALSEQHGVDVILTLGQTPAWASARPSEPTGNSPGNSAEPRNIEDWERYIRTVVTRYRGHIKAYELWNEPFYTEMKNQNSMRGSFSGSAVAMVKLAAVAHKVLNELDSNAKLISPSCTAADGSSGMDCTEQFLKAGGGQYVDEIGFHFYSSPEKIPELVEKIKVLTSRYGVGQLPIWNTESGYLVQGPDKTTTVLKNQGDPFNYVLSQEELPGYVLRSMLLSAVSGITRYYHYSWDIPTMHLMWKRGTEPTLASFGYAQSLRWLRGSTIKGCENKFAAVWSCELHSSHDHRGFIVWSQHGSSSVQLPKDFQAIAYETLDGHFNPIDSPEKITVNEIPVLVRSERPLW